MTREDVLTLLKADLGVAIIPLGAAQADGICNIPLNALNLVRKVSMYTVAGRQRTIACATLINMLRAADWGFATGTKQQRRARS
jgi:DNA-binding transcriptional LysR family regulator